MKLRAGLVLSLVLLSTLALAETSALPPAPPAQTVKPKPDTNSGWLGVSLGAWSAPNPNPLAAGDGAQEGVKVIGVVHGSPAQKAGLHVRDVILSVDGKPVSSPQDVISVVTSLPPGSSLTLNVSRRGDERIVTPTLDTRPTDASLMKMFDGWIGVEAIELPASLRQHFGAPAEAGVMISTVKEGGPAEAAGLSVGDVVFEVDGEPVSSIGALRNLIGSSGIDNRLEIRVMRDGAEIVVEPLVTARPDRDDR